MHCALKFVRLDPLRDKVLTLELPARSPRDLIRDWLSDPSHRDMLRRWRRSEVRMVWWKLFYGTHADDWPPSDDQLREAITNFIIYYKLVLCHRIGPDPSIAEMNILGYRGFRLALKAYLGLTYRQFCALISKM
jgi:hypothetical protein